MFIELKHWIFFAFISCIVISIEAKLSNVVNKTDIYKITDIKTGISLYEKEVLQIKIFWKDNLPNDTSYNVLVKSKNPDKCRDLPCSLYGILKPTHDLVIPENPMSYVAEKECNYMFGCNYTLTVETSNAMWSSTKDFTIPDCVMGTCSCRHASTLPKVITLAHTPTNDSISLNWSIKLKNVSDANTADILKDILLSKMYLKISEQTNPSLSWGGKLIPIAEYIYTLNSTSYIRKNDSIQGEIKIKVRQQMPPKAVLNLHTFIVDKWHCSGPANLIKVQVPASHQTKELLIEENLDMRIGLIVVSTLFSCAVLFVMVFYIHQRRKSKANSILTKNGNFLPPFPTIIEMQENINYVDKEVEEAQVNGIADMFEVPHQAIHMGSEIGEGAFGRVYKATAYNMRRMRGVTVVAVKQLKKNPNSDEVKEFLTEIEMLKGVGTHNNIVSFLGCCTIRAPYFIIMEYVGRGDLLSYLRTVRYETSKFTPKNANYSNNKRSPPAPTVKYIELKRSVQSVDSDVVTEFRETKPSLAETTYTIIDDDEFQEPFQYILDHKELNNFALQIASGMRFLEQQEITHRDLAARNILIDDRKTLKITDFGLSRHGVYTNTKTRKLPLRWLSIEAIRDNIYSSKSDVWAYGVVLWEIGTLGASPYPTISNSELIPYLLSGQRLPKPEICTEKVFAIMLQCWDEDVTIRPTFDELYKVMSPKTTYVDLNSLSDDYVFPPIKDSSQ